MPYGDILPAVDVRDSRAAYVGEVASDQLKVENLDEQPAAGAQASAELLDCLGNRVPQQEPPVVEVVRGGTADPSETSGS